MSNPDEGLMDKSVLSGSRVDHSKAHCHLLVSVGLQGSARQLAAELDAGIMMFIEEKKTHKK